MQVGQSRSQVLASGAEDELATLARGFSSSTVATVSDGRLDAQLAFPYA